MERFVCFPATAATRDGHPLVLQVRPTEIASFSTEGLRCQRDEPGKAFGFLNEAMYYPLVN